MSGNRPDMAADFTIEQDWRSYGEDEHAIWRLLFERQQKLLIGRACGEYLEGLDALGVAAGGIPDFGRLSDVLERTTGWRIVAVPGLVPDAVFLLIYHGGASRQLVSSAAATSSTISRSRMFFTTSAVTCRY